MALHDPVWGRAVSVEKTPDPGLACEKEQSLFQIIRHVENGNQDWKKKIEWKSNLELIQ